MQPSTTTSSSAAAQEPRPQQGRGFFGTSPESSSLGSLRPHRHCWNRAQRVRPHDPGGYFSGCGLAMHSGLLDAAATDDSASPTPATAVGRPAMVELCGATCTINGATQPLSSTDWRTLAALACAAHDRAVAVFLAALRLGAVSRRGRNAADPLDCTAPRPLAHGRGLAVGCVDGDANSCLSTTSSVDPTDVTLCAVRVVSRNARADPRAAGVVGREEVAVDRLSGAGSWPREVRTRQAALSPDTAGDLGVLAGSLDRGDAAPVAWCVAAIVAGLKPEATALRHVALGLETLSTWLADGHVLAPIVAASPAARGRKGRERQRDRHAHRRTQTHTADPRYAHALATRARRQRRGRLASTPHVI